MTENSEENRIISSVSKPEDHQESSLRPRLLEAFIGSTQIKEKFAKFILMQQK